ncbi:MAG: hypothetical protein M3N51_08700, partial [Actinomycetota bacterium]|nr:hypothetical protein [Actinomycetota bacterium]
MSTVPPLLQKVGLLAGAFGLVLALVVGLGWLLLPHAAFQPGGGARAAALALPSLDDLDGPVAVAVTQGDLEGRFVLDRLEGSDLADDRFRFTFSSPAFDSLMVNGRGVVGEPVTGDRLRVTFTLDGKNFFPDPTACTLQFARLTQTSPDRDAER